MNEHRWSGWPGAFCLDCEAEDQREICVSEHDVSITCIYGHVQCEDRDHATQRCSEHVNAACPGTLKSAG